MTQELVPVSIGVPTSDPITEQHEALEQEARELETMRRSLAGVISDDVDVGVHAAVLVRREVARGVAPLDVRGVGVVRREEPAVPRCAVNRC